jgi:hypothetical protein
MDEDLILLTMLDVLGDNRMSPIKWLSECNKKGIRIKAFSECIPLLLNANLIAYSVISFASTTPDQHRYYRIKD